jgi:putative acetyltransferase
MGGMIEIVPIQAGQISDAKKVIYAVAQRIFDPEKSIEEFTAELDQEHELRDVDNYREVYNDNRGLFLVVLDDGQVVGTGAIRKMEDEVAELKRIWLLEAYHGQKIGYRMLVMLLDFAREHGYTSVRLGTTIHQKRAQVFYKRFGFHEIPTGLDDPEEISMEMPL